MASAPIISRLLAVVLMLQLSGVLVKAQSDATPATGAPAAAATPTAAPNTGVTLIASGLTNPRGLTWDGAGALYVSSAGMGGPNPGAGSTMGDMGNTNTGGPSAGIDKIVAGCPVPVAHGLPSYLSGSGRYRGVADAAFLNGDLYALVEGGGPEKGNPNQQNGVYKINADGSGSMIADLRQWVHDNPVAHVPGDVDDNGDPFSMMSDGTALVLVEANSGQVLRVTPDGTISRIADVSGPHNVPTGMAIDKNGNIFLAYLMTQPYLDKGARVDRITPDGAVSTVWTGLTMLTGVAVDDQGVLYALEMSTDNDTTNPYYRESTGQLVRQTGPSSAEPLLTGLPQPIGLGMGPDQGLYISFPATGPVGVPATGGVIRFDPATDGPVAYDPAVLRANACGSAVATPAAAVVDPFSVVATGLANPRGLTWDSTGALYVAQSGTGETATSVGAAASVVRIENGCPVPVASGLPSSFDPFKDVMGPEDITFLNGQLYVLQGATGAFEDMNPATPNGVYRVEPDGRLTLIADLTTWLRADPVAHPPGDRNPLGEPFRILPADGHFWVIDSNSGEVLRVNLDGGVSRLADTSRVHHVVTAFALAPGGGMYLGFLTPSPHEDNTSKIVRVSADGVVTDIWTGLTTVTGIVVAPDGSLYASEMATGDNIQTGMKPNTGRIVRQTGFASLSEVVTGLDYPIDLDAGPDGRLYVSGPAYGAEPGDGWVLRVDPMLATGQAVPDGLIQKRDCPANTAPAATPGAVPTGTVESPVATAPAPAPVVTPDPNALLIPTAPPAPTAAPVETPAPGANGAPVTIDNFAFTPRSLQIKTGETVTWSNEDTVPHTATSTTGVFDSGNLNPGQKFSHTFNTAGTFPYVCQYHAGMTGEIVVTP